MPSDQYEIISGMPRSDLSDTTILEYLLKNNNAFGLTTVEPMYGELDNAFVGGAMDGAVVYEKTKENIELRIPYPNGHLIRHFAYLLGFRFLSPAVTGWAQFS